MLTRPVTNEDISESGYIVVDTLVKFDAIKLTPHKRKVIRKRREDIPTMHQDLFQS